MFLGYHEGEKLHTLWAGSFKGVKIITTTDVTFNEYEKPCLTEKNSKIH